MRRLLLAAVIVRNGYGHASRRYAGCPSRKFHRAGGARQLAGFLRRRPGRIWRLGRKLQRLDPIDDLWRCSPTRLSKVRWGFRNGISGSASNRHNQSGYGAFAGYNSQWDDVVVGVEMSYLHGKFGGSTTASEARSSGTALSDGYIHDVTATSSAAIAISDMATFRVRGGYAWGCFLPYMFGGVALGNANISRSVVRSGQCEAGSDKSAAPIIGLL